ncbi:unnamed protein product, partial [Iphiclides podalirius]
MRSAQGDVVRFLSQLSRTSRIVEVTGIQSYRVQSTNARTRSQNTARNRRPRTHSAFDIRLQYAKKKRCDDKVANALSWHERQSSLGTHPETRPGQYFMMARFQFFYFFAVTTIGIQSTSTLNASVGESTTPSVFREIEDNSRYKTLEANATLLKLLVDDKDGVSSSEVFDMLHSRDDNQQHIDLPSFPEDSEATRVEVTSVPDSDAEFLQVPGGTVRRDSQRLRYAGSRGEPIGAAAGIMVVVTCSIVCVAYTSLVVWRRIYLKRNGLKHELLRNEEAIAETRIEL